MVPDRCDLNDIIDDCDRWLMDRVEYVSRRCGGMMTQCALWSDLEQCEDSEILTRAWEYYETGSARGNQVETIRLALMRIERAVHDEQVERSKRGCFTLKGTP
jgi:hypothetical protein